MKKYDPSIHHRRSIRLNGYDYSQAGAYFITICCERRGNPSWLPFGKIENDEMVLNELGNIAYDEWVKLPERFPNFELDVFQIMPNHMHGIILLNDAVGATLAVAQIDKMVTPNKMVTQNDDLVTQNDKMVSPNKMVTQNDDLVNDDDSRAGASPAPTGATVGDIVGAYKSLVANACLEIYKSKNEMMGKLWQRNYWEHIIRNEQSYKTISEYIINNPTKWVDDKFYNQ